MLSRSPRPQSSLFPCLGSNSTSFATGSASPVRIASSHSRFMTPNMRRSAGTVSPVLIETMSPGTTSDDGTVTFFSISNDTCGWWTIVILENPFSFLLGILGRSRLLH